MKISVIIPCKNESDMIKVLLNSLVTQSRTADEVIIVVDSESTDDTADVAWEYHDILPMVVIDSNGPGLARARNNGAVIAKGDMFIFVDADLKLSPSFISHFERHIDRRKCTVGSFTQQMDSKNLIVRLGSRIMNGYMRFMQHTPWPVGFSCLYASSQAFKLLQGFDESLYIMEDYDFLMRAKGIGCRVEIIDAQCQSSDRRYRSDCLKQVLRGIYGEFYRYTHHLRVTKPIYQYNMGGKSMDNGK